MKILLSGASGFLGNIIKKELVSHECVTIGRRNCDIFADISKPILEFLPASELFIHAAGMAHSTPKNEVEKRAFYDINVIGTLNLLKALEQQRNLKRIIFISSVSVYGIKEGWDINETDDLKAQDPYGRSKIEAESLISQWCAKRNIIYTILRLPLIAGPNPPGNLGSMIKGLKSGYYFNIDAGLAKKSIVLAKDVAKYILPASEVGGIYNLTDGYHPSFRELSYLIASQLNMKPPFNVPYWAGNLLAKCGDVIGSSFPINSSKLEKIISHLTFDDSKAREVFGWAPTPVLEGFKVTE